MTQQVIMDVLRNAGAIAYDGERHPPFSLTESAFLGRMFGVRYSELTGDAIQMQSRRVAAPTHGTVLHTTRLTHVVGERGVNRNEPIDDLIVMRAAGMGAFDAYVLPVLMGRLDVEMQDGEDFWDLVDDMVGEVLRAQLSQTTANQSGAPAFITAVERRLLYDTLGFYLNAVRERLASGYVVTGVLNRPKEAFGVIAMSKETDRDLFG